MDKTVHYGDKILTNRDGSRQLGPLIDLKFLSIPNCHSWLHWNFHVSRLTNDPILHSPYWPPIPSKILSDCPKFEGETKEDPQTHVMIYHLWCSSNSYVDDSIHLQLFQRTLTGDATKWYIELPRNTYHDFNTLTMAFLTNF